MQQAKSEGPHVTQPATTQELIADVLLMHLPSDDVPSDDDAYTAADAILRDPALTIRPRVILTGEWETVRDQLERLPEGTQIRWRTGHDEHLSLAIKIASFRELRWASTDSARLLNATNIARDNTPIEILA